MDRLEIVSSEKIKDGSFARDLADSADVPVELGIGGTWTGSRGFWEHWVEARVVGAEDQPSEQAATSAALAEE